MTSPYSPDEHVLEPAQSATELISLYRDKYNIDIDYRLCDVDFGASWERDGTALRSLEQIAAIFDAQIVATESGLRIEQFAQSERDVIELDLHHFLEREPTPQLEMRYPISTVIIQTADSDERPAGHHTEISCSASIQNERVLLRLVPHDSFQSSEGIHNLREIITLEEKTGNINSDYIRLDGDIYNIVGLSINGEEITDYTFSHDMIILSQTVTGVYHVVYHCWGMSGYLNVFTVGEERGYSYSVKYGNGLVYCDSGTLKSDASAKGGCGGAEIRRDGKNLIVNSYPQLHKGETYE